MSLPQSILMVCTGNICRSPTAEAALSRALRAEGGHTILVDSAGITGSHIGEPADRRSQMHALQRGIDLSSHRARGVNPRDFKQFDLILSMDSGHQKWLEEACPDPSLVSRILPFLSFHPRADRLEREAPNGLDVPDPYFGSSNGFDLVLDLIEQTTPSLVDLILDNGKGS